VPDHLREIAGVVGRILARDPGEIDPDARLVDDLGFDSLMLTELTVSMLEAGLLDDDAPADVQWETVTIRDLANGRLSSGTVDRATLEPCRSKAG
jgi:acyl carrier protein